MKIQKFLAVLLMTISMACFADEDGLGTPDHPQIDGAAYDLHKPYIEPNQGYSVATPASGVSNQDSPSRQQTYPANSSKQIIIKQNNNMASDNWTTDPAYVSKVERALKQAASGGKLSYVLDQAKQKQVPVSVAIVPMVESNYNKNAVSPKGAGGAWQLMPGTANDYGLSSKDLFDFQNSTKAAIELLKDLHSQFGNWNLAFAAYNCGSQCVINALKKNPDAKSFDELSLPAETKAYVHKIIQFNQVIAGLDNASPN